MSATCHVIRDSQGMKAVGHHTTKPSPNLRSIVQLSTYVCVESDFTKHSKVILVSEPKDLVKEHQDATVMQAPLPPKNGKFQTRGRTRGSGRVNVVLLGYIFLGRSYFPSSRRHNATCNWKVSVDSDLGSRSPALLKVRPRVKRRNTLRTEKTERSAYERMVCHIYSHFGLYRSWVLSKRQMQKRGIPTFRAYPSAIIPSSLKTTTGRLTFLAYFSLLFESRDPCQPKPILVNFERKQRAPKTSWNSDIRPL